MTYPSNDTYPGPNTFPGAGIWAECQTPPAGAWGPCIEPSNMKPSGVVLGELTSQLTIPDAEIELTDLAFEAGVNGMTAEHVHRGKFADVYGKYAVLDPYFNGNDAMGRYLWVSAGERKVWAELLVLVSSRVALPGPGWSGNGGSFWIFSHPEPEAEGQINPAGFFLAIHPLWDSQAGSTDGLDIQVGRTHVTGPNGPSGGFRLALSNAAPQERAWCRVRVVDGRHTVASWKYGDPEPAPWFDQPANEIYDPFVGPMKVVQRQYGLRIHSLQYSGGVDAPGSVPIWAPCLEPGVTSWEPCQTP